MAMAGQSSRRSSQRLSRDLTCSICLDLFKQPVSLPCDHTFCQGCITGFWAGPRSQGGAPTCPQCRTAFPGQSYRPNRIVANIVESYCQGLEESGEPCRGPVELAPLCGRHHEELKLYCEEDQELVCLVCAVSQEHRAHTLASIQEAQSRYRASLGSSMTALQAELNTALQCEREAEEEVKKLKDHTADLKHRIETQFSDLHQFLYQEEKMLQVKLKTEERRELIRLDEYKAVLCVEISRLRRAMAEIEDKLKEQNAFLLLKNIKALLQRQPLKFERPAHTVPSLCEGQFAGPLQYKVWKSLKGILYPAPAAITFNASTANPWLSLTSSLTCVRYQTFNNAVQDNPQRFNAALSLLGSQGFTHGQHYWEIEVYSSTVWTLGVARESVARKGVIKALPANGFWTLSLSYGVQYMAGTAPPTVLSVEDRLARIGVYLDYKRGLVSFYNAENMVHLYTFHETFTETLYPYFNLGFLDKVHENEPLKVFLPKI
ncbi:E3 ubiquitin-protein ligase TRIM69 [Megalops cyprinoides]|uniref:E3 ubiquitin-protein ligase TRIM69 n=1 Tax=Megalops cyprinoides TaxID=118141 RepID=UPI001864B520|nr:E3 ubiquitin-protein ligase TRIM69 [Megalops cyprinoides]